MPQLGESVTEGTLGKWLKAIGETVTKYEPLVEVITDKVNAEIPSDFEGIMTEQLVQEGETVNVGTIICRISESTSAEPTLVSPNGEAVLEPVVLTASQPSAQGSGSQVGRYSPAVLTLAQENSVNLADVTGTGEGGRITRKDVLNYISQGQSKVQAVAPATAQTALDVSPKVGVDAAPVSQTKNTLPSTGDEDIVEPSSIRKMIARRMVDSKHTAPHAWTMMEADVSSLVGLRNSVKSEFKRKEGIDLTFLPFFIKAVVEGLKQYPILNASWVDDTIHMKKRINVSIAVATDEALVVPVIHDADRLSIAGIAHAVNDLAARARAGKLSLQDVQGGTFTVNNTGAFGSILSQPIINAPQAAILSVESIVKRPVVVNDAIAIRSMVNLCLSLDHRILDGWVAGHFLKTVKERLQTFGADTALF